MNHGGRIIEYPGFGDRQVAPPGVAVRASPCQAYYSSHDPRKISHQCWDCLYNESSVIHPSAALHPSPAMMPYRQPKPYTCDCQLDRNYSPANFCQYAKCVEAQHKDNGSCDRAYNAIYNVDDVKDDKYLPSFSFSNLHC
jgi:hypothetical protein